MLRVLAENRRIDTKTLADRSSILFPSFTRIVTTLRKKGLVTRIRDEIDRRCQFIVITPTELSFDSSIGAPIIENLKCFIRKGRIINMTRNTMHIDIFGQRCLNL